MKKICVFLLALVIAIGGCSFSFAAEDPFDMSVLRSNDNLDIDVNSEKNVAFVETTLSIKDKSFTHECESENLYSAIYFDMLIIDYFDSDAYPILRMWIDFCTDDEFKYINAVSFTVNDTEYRFSDIADSEWFTELNNGYKQECLIKFGSDNLTFLVAVENLFDEWLDKMGDDTFDWSQEVIPMVLHGKKDIKASIPARFLVEFLIMKRAYIDSNGINSCEKCSATPMKTSTVEK